MSIGVQSAYETIFPLALGSRPATFPTCLALTDAAESSFLAFNILVLQILARALVYLFYTIPNGIVQGRGHRQIDKLFTCQFIIGWKIKKDMSATAVSW